MSNYATRDKQATLHEILIREKMLDVLLLIGVQTPFAIDASRRLPIFVAPVLTMLYIIGAELFYVFVASGLAPLDVVPTPTQIGVFHHGIIFIVTLAGVFAAAYLGTLGYQFKAQVDNELNQSNLIIIEFSAFLLGVIWVLVNLFSENPQILWRNSTYLATSSPILLQYSGGVFDFMLKTLPFVGIFLAAILGLALRRRGYRMAAALSFPFAYIFLFHFSGHSRNSAVMLATLALVLLTAASKKMKFAGYITISVAIFAWVSALIGRGSGQHGFAAIPSTIGDVFSDSNNASPLLDALANFFEGPFVLATSSNMQLDYPSVYKFLSFSPLPSFIDHFDSIRDVYQIRIGPYFPVSGYAEAYSFGPIFFITLLAFAFTMFRTASAITKRRGGLLSTLINMLIVINIVLLFAYNLRNGFRLMFYSEALGLAVIYSSVLLRVLQSGSGYFQAARLNNARQSG